MKTEWLSIPAIDLSKGLCVRLREGRRSEITYYSDSPLALAKRYEALGAKALHLVDLDGAFGEKLQQYSVMEAIAKETSLTLQVGGGIRTRQDILRLKELGVSRFIVGTLALRQPKLCLELIEEFGVDAIILALDFRLSEGRLGIASHAWQELDYEKLEELKTHFASIAGLRLLCTHIDKDGTLEGIDQNPYTHLQAEFPRQEILASGGIKDLGDILRLKELGLKGAVIGKALLEGRIEERSLWRC